MMFTVTHLASYGVEYALARDGRRHDGKEVLRERSPDTISRSVTLGTKHGQNEVHKKKEK